MKEDIKNIIYNKSIGMTDKLVQIDRIVSGAEWKAADLAAALDIPLIAIMEQPEAVLFKPAPAKLNTKAYIDTFHIVYSKIKNKKYIFTPADIGQIKNLCKSIDLEEFTKILNYICFRKQQEKTVKLEWDMDRIIKSLTPCMIYKNLNYLVAEAAKSKTKGWGYGR